jgi:hypothetical protein
MILAIEGVSDCDDAKIRFRVDVSEIKDMKMFTVTLKTFYFSS